MNMVNMGIRKSSEFEVQMVDGFNHRKLGLLFLFCFVFIHVFTKVFQQYQPMIYVLVVPVVGLLCSLQN